MHPRIMLERGKSWSELPQGYLQSTGTKINKNRKGGGGGGGGVVAERGENVR